MDFKELTKGMTLQSWALVIFIIISAITSVSSVYSYNKSVNAESELRQLKAEQKIDDPYNEQIARLAAKNDELIKELAEKRQKNTELQGTIANRDKDIKLLEDSIRRVYLDMPNEDNIREGIQNEDLKGICGKFDTLGFPCDPIG